MLYGNNLETAVRGGLEGLVTDPPDSGCKVSPHRPKFVMLGAINSNFRVDRFLFPTAQPRGFEGEASPSPAAALRAMSRLQGVIRGVRWLCFLNCEVATNSYN